MIEAKKVISNNLLDVDSNLSAIYQLLDEYRQMQTLILTASDYNTGQVVGIDPAYSPITFSGTRTSNFASDYFKLGTDGTIILDQTIVPHFFLTVSLQLNSPAAAIGKTFYMQLGFAYGEEETFYQQSAYRMITPFTANSNELRETVNYNVYVDIPSGVTRVKVYCATNASESPTISRAFLKAVRVPSYAQ